MPKPQPHIPNLSEVAMPAIIAAFAEAFSDYAVTFDPAQTEAMLTRRGLCPELSFAAWEDGRIVAFTLTGTGTFRSIATCYDCATATIPSRRGLGLGGALFRHALPHLAASGARQYLLEVLTTNERAIALYTGAGFSRDTLYLCYGGDTALSLPHGVCPPAGISLRPIDPGVLHGCATFTDFTPSWQNSFESIERGAGNLVMTGAFDNCQGRCVGYCVADPATGDISQIAVDQTMRRRGIGRAMLSAMAPELLTGRFKLLNIDEHCHSLLAFLDALGIERGLSQYAMLRPLP